MFQFITITYNHEKYIVEHLESIRYQIENYKIKNSTLTICDDCSTDRTLEVIELWLDKNRSLFNDVKILKSDSNKGIVSNYLRAVNDINCNKYKILAGDDLYYCNPIQDVLKEFDFVATPAIEFTDYMNFKLNIRYSEAINTVKKVKKILKKDNAFFAPGVFIKREIIKNEDLIQHITMFKWIEDYPTWQYLFMKSGLHIKYKSSCIPYVMYRSNVGIYGNSNALSENRKMFLLEEERMYKYYGVNRDKVSPNLLIYLNPKNYIRKLTHLLGLDKNIEDVELANAKEYYSIIRGRASTFLIELESKVKENEGELNGDYNQ